MKKFISILTLVLASLSASAEEFEVNGINYMPISDNEVSVTSDNRNDGGLEYSGDIVIPKEVQWNGKTYQVAELGGGAFYQCTKVTSVTLPNTIRAIGERCFESCFNLTSINLPNSIKDIGRLAFLWCTRLASITLPKNLEFIKDGCFDGCESLESVVIPDGVIEIQTGAFNQCFSLESVEIPNSVVRIGSGAFEYTSLSTVVIPNSVAELGNDAFSNTWIETVVLSENIDYFGSHFDNCKEIKSFTSLNKVPPRDVSTGTEPSFVYDVYNKATLYVPKGCKAAYSDENNRPWCRFSNIVEIDTPSEIPTSEDVDGWTVNVEYGGTSVSVGMSQSPQIINREGIVELRTNTMTVEITLPCKISFAYKSNGGTSISDAVDVRNNHDNTPINVFTLDGKKVAVLKDKSESLSLKRGVYIINGKKFLVK